MRGRALVAGVLGLAGVMLFAAPAYAHSFLVSSTPAVGETLSELPENFSVTMNESLLDLSGDAAGFGMRVRDDAGLYYGDGCITISGDTLSTPAALGGAGSYTLIYQVVSSDGHPVSDEFTFEWAPRSAVEPAVGVQSAPNCGKGDAGAPAPTDEQPAQSASVSGDVLWIGGGILAIIIAVGATLLAVKPRKQP
ncbi:MAG: copper resistance CopC family protein [Microbacteriaceae bacterium]